MVANAYIVGGTAAGREETKNSGPSPIGKIAAMGFEHDESPEMRYEKLISAHVFVAVIVVQVIALMGWSELILIVLQACILFISIPVTLLAYFLSKNHGRFRTAVLVLGLSYLVLHFFAQGCNPIKSSIQHSWVILLLSLLFHIPMGGTYGAPIAGACVYFLVFVIASAIEAVGAKCYDISAASVVDTWGLTFVNAIFPGFMCFAIATYEFNRMQKIVEKRKVSEEFAKNALRNLMRQDFHGLSTLCTEYDASRSEQEEPLMSDEAILVAAEHINSLRELVPSHLRGGTDDMSTTVQHISRKTSMPNINAGSNPPGSMLSAKFVDVDDHSDSRSADDEKGELEAVPLTTSPSADMDPFAQPPMSKLTPGDTASGIQSPSRSPLEGPVVAIGRRKSRAFSEAPLPKTPSHALEGSTLRRKSSIGNFATMPMTYEPSFIVVFTLPYMNNYVTRSVKNVDVLKMVYTDFYDSARKSAFLYHGSTLWSGFATVYAKFHDIHSAGCAAVAMLDMMKHHARAIVDHYLLDTKAHQPLAIILHAHLLSGLVGSEPSSMVTMGASPADKVVGQIIEASAMQAIPPPAVVGPAVLKRDLETEFEFAESAHPALFVIERAKEVNPDGYPTCSTSPPFVDIEKTEVFDFESLASEMVSGLIRQGEGGQHGRDDRLLSFDSGKDHEEHHGDETVEDGINTFMAQSASLSKRRRLPPEVLEIWHRFDADRSGYLDVDEVRDVLVDMGFTMTDDELKVFFDSVDSDHSGTVSLDEFQHAFFSATLGGANVMSNIRRAAVAMARNTGTDNLPIVLNAWKKYDLDGSGDLQPEELFLCLKDLNMAVSEEEVDWLVGFVDKNGNGKIEFDEFAALFSEDDQATIKMNLVKERIQTVSRVLTNQSNQKVYSNDEQAERDKLMHLDSLVNHYFVLPITLYILYNYGIGLYGLALGPDLYMSLEHIIIDLVLDFAIYGLWVGLKLGFLPRESNGQIIWKRKEVLRAAVRHTEFWIDLLVVLPLDFIFIGLSGQDYPDGRYGIIAYYRIGKLLGLYHFEYCFSHLTRALEPSTVRIWSALIYFWGFAHIFGCALIMTARDIGQEHMSEMLVTAHLLDEVDTMYMKSFYWAILSMAGQLVGPALSPRDELMYLLLAAVLVGLPMFTVIIGTIGNAVQVENAEARFLTKIDTLRGYFSYTHMPRIMEDECVAYYRHVFNTTGSLDINDNPLEELPVELSVPVTVEIGREMLKRVSMFSGVIDNLEFVHELASKLVPRVLEPGIIIMKKGDRGANMYFLTYGECQVLTDPGPKGFAVFTFKKGSFFGEIALLHNVKRTATIGVGKKGYANVLTLDKKHFDEVAQIFPQAFSQIYKAAEERIKEVLAKEAEEAKAAKEKRRQEKLEKRRKEREAAGLASEDFDEEEDIEEEEGSPAPSKLAKSLAAELSRPVSQQASHRPVVDFKAPVAETTTATASAGGTSSEAASPRSPALNVPLSSSSLFGARPQSAAPSAPFTLSPRPAPVDVEEERKEGSTEKE